MKFKKGDIVRIVKLHDVFTEKTDFDEHQNLLGKEFEVGIVYDDWDYQYALIGEELWLWGDDNLELVK